MDVVLLGELEHGGVVPLDLAESLAQPLVLRLQGADVGRLHVLRALQVVHLHVLLLTATGGEEKQL